MGKKFISASASVCLLKFLSSFPSGQVKRKAGSDLSRGDAEKNRNSLKNCDSSGNALFDISSTYL